MSREQLFIILPVVGVWIIAFIQSAIDWKYRKILKARGKNPKPKELEGLKGIYLPGEQLERFRQGIEFRKTIDPNLGQWYVRTHIMIIAMILLFIIMAVLLT